MDTRTGIYTVKLQYVTTHTFRVYAAGEAKAKEAAETLADRDMDEDLGRENTCTVHAEVIDPKDAPHHLQEQHVFDADGVEDAVDDGDLDALMRETRAGEHRAVFVDCAVLTPQ